LGPKFAAEGIVVADLQSFVCPMSLEALSHGQHQVDNDDLFSRLSSQLSGDQRKVIENSQWARDYVISLTGMSLEDLQVQPQKLTQEDQIVEKEIQNLAFQEYPTFIA
jgi:hypothetical protein